MTKLKNFLTPEQEKEIVTALRTAEKNTSGEIRIHLESHSKKEAYDRAADVFDMLEMHKTKQRNGVLIYIAVEDRTLVILGDTGINDVVAPDFWESTKDLIINNFKNDDITKGLVEGVLKAGDQLQKHFPYSKNDKNELPDEISFG